ncbi:MAG: carboxypeptidase-like regulatory domain-containing protein [Gemmatirosa sp.]
MSESPFPSPRVPLVRLARALPIVGIATSVAWVAACSDGESRPVRAAPTAPRPNVPTDVTLPGVAPVPGGYTVRAVTDGGSITGVVTLAGDAPRDTTVRPDASLARPCGASLVDRAVSHRGALVEGAIVWLSDVRAGKASTAPRRHELTLERCQLHPRVAALPAGATLNVKGRDPLSMQLRATAWPAGDARAAWRMTDAGQVVPDDRVLATAGTLEVRGESLPWVRAWLLVFDQPYYATTSPAGTFMLDTVPPGRYTLVAWHPRLGRVEQPVTVAAGQGATVTIALGSASETP